MRTYGRQQLVLRKKSGRSIWARRALFASLGLVGIFVLANLVLFVLYRDKVSPNVFVGSVAAGGVRLDQLDEKIPAGSLMPVTIQLTKDDKKSEVSTTDLGVIVDWPATREKLGQQRSWLPLLNLVKHRTVPVELTIDEQQFAAAQAAASSVFAKDALPERIVFSGQNFEKAAPGAGYKLDQRAFKPEVLAAIKAGKTAVVVPTENIEPPASEASLDSSLQELRKKLAVQITFMLNGQTIKPGAADIGKWFVPNAQSMVFSMDKAEEYVASLGTAVYNKGNAAAAASYALDKITSITFALSTNQASAKYTYCAATKDVNQSHLAGFIAKTAAVLGDPRGWNKGGSVAFERVDSDCDFSLWLSAPAQMTSFGGLCDSYYSCRSGRNVVINFDRWQGATDPWNAAGGSLEDYRVMVTNHEVGHWLGFGHGSCPGPGQPAPVMQQQSISLGGCVFNPWPTPAETSRL